MTASALTTLFVDRIIEQNTGAEARLLEPAARSLLDFCACVRAGRSMMAAGWPASLATRLAVAAHSLDRDDLHWASLCHPGGVIWPVAVQVGSQYQASGPEIVTAVSVGYDATVDLAAALGPSHRRHWHATCSAGGVGAAITAAFLMHLPPCRIADAAAHAASLAGGSIRALAERSGTRLVHRAHAVSTGLLCAEAAARGVGGTVFGLEDPDGLFAATAPLGDPVSLTRTHARPALAAAGPRLRATSGFGQAAVDAAVELGPVDPQTIKSIVICVSAAACDAAGELDPGDKDAAWWSIPYAVARCLIAGDAGALEGQYARSADVGRLLGLTRIEPGEHSAGAGVDVGLMTGERLRTALRVPTGHPDRPASEQDLATKWKTLANGDGNLMLDQLRGMLERPWGETIRLGLGSAGC